MELTAEQPAIQLTEDQLAPVQELYDQGLMIRAFEASKAIGPLRQWRGAAGRVLAGRLANNLGAPRLGRVLHRLAHREDPRDPEAAYFNVFAVFERRGPFFVRELLREKPDLSGASDKRRAEWFTLHARLAGDFRDFAEADRWMKKALDLAPEDSWVLVERAGVLERQDRYPEALASVRRALGLRPWYRPAIQEAAHLLELLGEDQEAHKLLLE